MANKCIVVWGGLGLLTGLALAGFTARPVGKMQMLHGGRILSSYRPTRTFLIGGVQARIY